MLFINGKGIGLVVILGSMLLIWRFRRFIAAKRVQGKKALIHPFREESLLHHVGILEVKLETLKKRGDEYCFICRLDRVMKIEDFEFDYVVIYPKVEDEDFSTKKSRISYVLGGKMGDPKEPLFIDWGLVKVIS